ncbi:MAG: sensor histidine kinase [Dysgonamonadaceae bacterium]|jgi:signal transduction histidine kinase|nr:sensor histidine kinase [Dysgonamonadaceae bacterium]
MSAFNSKDIDKLNISIKWIEKLSLVCIALVVIAFYINHSNIAWMLFIALIILYVVKARLNKQLKQKEYLAKVVEERTTELKYQRDQVMMESEKLSAALAALAEAQDELIRQERFATVGQLTKGLVDRILNPLNYINNFAGLSIELIRDLEIILTKAHTANVNKEESLEVLKMISGNLEKITEHGANTVRIVKAMEEILKDQKGKMSAANINNLCKINLDVIRKLYTGEIEEKKINIHFRGLVLSLIIDINIEQMSKVLLHLFKNSIYALVKKASKDTNFSPKLVVSLERLDENLAITVYDNGTGIDDSIKERIFEPFFTTKPTAEAAGTGLYISREIIFNHKGTISVKSEKDKFTEFKIIVPIHQNFEP